jgi:hypothetical protein
MAPKNISPKPANLNPAPSKDLVTQILELLAEHQRAGVVQATPTTPPEAMPHIDETETDDFVDPSETEDRRMRSRKVYFLAEGASDKTNQIPTRPSACRRVFRYLQKYEVGTVKQIAHSLQLEKKTIGNALAALKQVSLVDAGELPKNA